MTERPAGVTERQWSAWTVYQETGSIAETARRLGVSSSAVRRTIEKVKRREQRAGSWQSSVGISGGTMNRLAWHVKQTGDSRYLDPDSLAAMSDADLMAVRGLGATGRRQLREALGVPTVPCPHCGGTGKIVRRSEDTP